MAGTKEARRAPADKYDERRNQLAESALQTLGELGYARTSLREIANNSEFSHGVVHYYFADKFELIIYCVRYYKAALRDPLRRGRRRRRPRPRSCSTRSPRSSSRRSATRRPMHRLWYDLRTQSMFEDDVPRGRR